MSDPAAKPSTKMETTNVANVFDEVWKSVMTCSTPGANIEDTRGLSRVKSWSMEVGCWMFGNLHDETYH